MNNKTGLTRRQVYAEASLINSFLLRRGVNAPVAAVMVKGKRTPKFVLTPWAVVYSLNVDPGQSFDKISAITDDLAAHVHKHRVASTNGMDTDTIRKTKTIARFVGPAMTIEISRWKPDTLIYDKLSWTPTAPLTALAGVAFDFLGRYAVEWMLANSDQANMLLSGMTGSGKTNALVQLMLSLTLTNSPENLLFDVIDMKPSPDLIKIGDLPHVQRIAREPEDALQLLRMFARDMDHRYRSPGESFPRHVLVIDELMSIAELDKVQREEAQTLLGKIAGKCREAGMNMLCCTLKPTNDILGSQFKSQMTIRYTGRMDTPEDAKVATGIAQSGAHMLPGKGVFHWRSNDGMSTVQAAFMGDIDARIEQVCQRWGKTTTIDLSCDSAPSVQPRDEPVANVSRLDAHFAEYWDNDRGAFVPKGLIEAKRILFGDEATSKGRRGVAQKEAVMQHVNDWIKKASAGASAEASEGVPKASEKASRTPEAAPLPERKARDASFFQNLSVNAAQMSA